MGHLELELAYRSNIAWLLVWVPCSVCPGLLWRGITVLSRKMWPRCAALPLPLLSAYIDIGSALETMQIMHPSMAQTSSKNAP